MLGILLRYPISICDIKYVFLSSTTSRLKGHVLHTLEASEGQNYVTKIQCNKGSANVATQHISLSDVLVSIYLLN